MLAYVDTQWWVSSVEIPPHLKYAIPLHEKYLATLLTPLRPSSVPRVECHTCMLTTCIGVVVVIAVSIAILY